MKNIQKTTTIYFDLDGTLVDLYKDRNWLKRIEREDITLYTRAPLLINQKAFIKVLTQLKLKGYRIGVISYTPWESSKAYKDRVKMAKLEYLRRYFPEDIFDEIHIIDRSIPKHAVSKGKDVLVDDEKHNRIKWPGKSYKQDDLINKLKRVYKLC